MQRNGGVSSKVPSFPPRLSLNENPFGPSSLAVEAIKDQLSEVCRFSGDMAAALTQAIAARENVSSDQIVLGEILKAWGFTSR
jgi:histidinol-phosphate aminotransferase